MDITQLGAPIARGRTAEIYAWGPGLVLKLFYDWFSPVSSAYEARISRIISTKTLPSPKMLEQVEIEKRVGLVFERVDGPSLLKIVNKQPLRLVELGRKLAEAHSDIHRENGEGLEPMRQRLEWMINHAEDLPADLREVALEKLAALPDGSALCHGDLHMDQVLLSANGLVVIDWNNATQGDPAADVARSVLMLTVSEPPDADPMQLFFMRRLRGIARRAYLKRYLKLNPGVSRASVQDWLIPIAAARLRDDVPGEAPHLVRLLRVLTKTRPSG